MDNLSEVKKALDSFVERQKSKMMAKEMPSISAAVGQEIGKLTPLLKDIASAVKENTQEIRGLELKSPDVHISSPVVNVPDINVPRPQVTVNVPETKFPKFPEFPTIPEYPKPKEYSWKNPMPVLLTDVEGRPYTAGWTGGSGGNFNNLAFLNNAPIATNTGVANDGALRVVFASDVGASVTVSGFTASIASVPTNNEGVVYNTDNPLPITSGATLTVQQLSGATDSVSIASQPFTFDVKQVSGSIDSVSIVGNIATLDVKQMSGDVSSTVINSTLVALDVKQVSGDVSSTVINSIVSPIGQGDSASALRTIQAGDSVSSISIATQPFTLDVKQLSGSSDSVFVTNPVGQGDSATALRVIHAGDVAASTKTVNVAMTTNPTAASDAADNFVKTDKIGRTLSRPVQVRELMQTAYVSISTGTETTLLAGIAATFLDLVYIMGSNSSDAAVTVDLRAATGAGIVTSIRIPANGTAGVSLPVPIPQDTLAATWTADLPDITGTTVTLGALFSKEI